MVDWSPQHDGATALPQWTLKPWVLNWETAQTFSVLNIVFFSIFRTSCHERALRVEFYWKLISLSLSVQLSSISFILQSDWGPDPWDARPLPASQCGKLYPDPRGLGREGPFSLPLMFGRSGKDLLPWSGEGVGWSRRAQTTCMRMWVMVFPFSFFFVCVCVCVLLFEND